MRILKSRFDKEPGQFKTIYTVALDTLANKTYNFNQLKLKQKAEDCVKYHPKISKITSFTLRYSYGLALACLERKISQYTGPVVSSSIVYSNPFVLSKIYSHVNTKFYSEEPNQTTKKPNMATCSGTFALLENGSIPLYFFLMGTIASFSLQIVSPIVAALAVVTSNLVAMVAEIVGFTAIWSKVLTTIPRGKLSDMVHGFISEFKPFDIYSTKQRHNPAKTAFEYIGQVWGVIESNYLWVQLTRIGYAVILTLTNQVPSVSFVDSFIGFSAQWGFGIVSGLITAKCSDSISNKIEENNKSLYTTPPASSEQP